MAVSRSPGFLSNRPLSDRVGSIGGLEYPVELGIGQAYCKFVSRFSGSGGFVHVRGSGFEVDAQSAEKVAPVDGAGSQDQSRHGYASLAILTVETTLHIIAWSCLFRCTLGTA